MISTPSPHSNLALSIICSNLFGRDRLERVLQRAQAALEGRSASLLSRAKEAFQPTRALSRVFVRDGNRIVPIALASIERVQGADDYATLFHLAEAIPRRIRLSDLENVSSAREFLANPQIASHQPRYVASIEPYDATRVEVVMKSGARNRRQPHGFETLRDLPL